MYEADTLERYCADVWPAIVDQPLGQWRLRAAGGFTGRANSALTLGDPGLPVPAALARIVTFATSHGIPPAAHVIVGSPLEADLAGAHWQVDHAHPGGAESVVLTGPLPGDTSANGVAAVTMTDEPPAGWWPLAVGDAEPTVAQRHVLTGWPGAGFGTARDHGEIVGIVRGAVIGDLLHIARLAVASTHRRRGLGLSLLAALGHWGRRRGARQCVLQVATHNEAAISLYSRLGALPHHRYRYWTPR